MTKKRIISMILALSVIFTVFSGTIMTKAAVDLQSDKDKLLTAISNTNQADRILIVKAIATAQNDNYTPEGQYTLKDVFTGAALTTAANTIWTELGANENVIEKATVESGLVQFKAFYDANTGLGNFILAQLTGTLKPVDTPNGLGGLGDRIVANADTYRMFINSLLYLKEYLKNSEPLEELADGKITTGAVLTVLIALYHENEGSDNKFADRLKQYEARLTYLLDQTNSWSNTSEKNVLINDLKKRGLVKAYTAPSTGGDTGTVVTPTPTPAPPADKEIINVDAKPADSNGVAPVDIPEKDLNVAFNKVAPAADGTKTVTVVVKEVPGAKAYAPSLPTNTVASGNSKNIVELETPVAKLAVPGDMFAKSDVGAAASVKMIMGVADASIVKDEAAKKKIGSRPVIELKVEVNGAAKAWNNPDAPVAVSVAYKPTAEELKNPDFITVYYIDGAGKLTVVPNAKYDSKKGMVTFTTTHFSKYAVAYEYKTFTDLAKYSWAKTSIEALAAKGILEGVSEDTFSPQTNITRDEFLAGVIRALGLSAKADENFADVKETNKYYNEIAMAKKLGITSGIGGNKFGTDTFISRQDMMTLILRAIKIKGYDLKSTGTDKDIEKFTDKTKISSYAKESVATCVKEGIIIGSSNKLNPTGNLTKAEAAVVLLRVFKK